jgi:ribokinase
MHTSQIVVVGAMNSDYLIKGDRFPKPGETLLGNMFLSAAGGKGANQAVAAARLGARVALISCVGNDERGRDLRERVASEGVNIDHVREIAHVETGAAVIMINAAGEKQIVAFPGASNHISAAQIEQAAPVIKGAKVLLLQFEAPIETILVAAKLARHAGVKVVLDPAPPIAMPGELASLLHAIRPNAHEAEMLTGLPVRDRASALIAGRQLQRRGIRIVAVQGGGDGNWLLWDDQEIWLPKVSVASVDATGAGDAFAAALAVAIVENQEPERGGRFCNAAAALTTTKLGAQPSLPNRHAVDELVSSGAMTM